MFGLVINGAHSLIYSSDSDADRAFLRDVLGLPNVDVFIATMSENGVRCGDIEEAPWGRITRIELPSGAALRVYQPLHQRPPKS